MGKNNRYKKRSVYRKVSLAKKKYYLQKKQIAQENHQEKLENLLKKETVTSSENEKLPYSSENLVEKETASSSRNKEVPYSSENLVEKETDTNSQNKKLPFSSENCVEKETASSSGNKKVPYSSKNLVEEEIVIDSESEELPYSSENLAEKETAIYSENTKIQLSYEESLQLEEQIRKFVQLLTQNYLLSHGKSELYFINQSSKQILEELYDVALENNAFNAHNLIGALDIVKQFEKKERILSTKYPRGISHAVRKTIFTSEVFMYPELLPTWGFIKEQKHKKVTFTHAEDYLIALGLERFSNDFDPVHRIHTHMMACKTEQQIRFRIKNLRSSMGYENNPIKYYYTHKEVPLVPRSVQIFDPNKVKPPIFMVDRKLPEWMVPLFSSRFTRVDFTPKVQNIIPKPLFILPKGKVPVILPKGKVPVQNCNKLKKKCTKSSYKPPFILPKEAVIKTNKEIYSNVADELDLKNTINSKTKCESKQNQNAITNNAIKTQGTCNTSAMLNNKIKARIMAEVIKTDVKNINEGRTEPLVGLPIKCVDKGTNRNVKNQTKQVKGIVTTGSSEKNNIKNVIKKKNAVEQNAVVVRPLVLTDGVLNDGNIFINKKMLNFKDVKTLNVDNEKITSLFSEGKSNISNIKKINLKPQKKSPLISDNQKQLIAPKIYNITQKELNVSDKEIIKSTKNYLRSSVKSSLVSSINATKQNVNLPYTVIPKQLDNQTHLLTPKVFSNTQKELNVCDKEIIKSTKNYLRSNVKSSFLSPKGTIKKNNELNSYVPNESDLKSDTNTRCESKNLNVLENILTKPLNIADQKIDETANANYVKKTQDIVVHTEDPIRKGVNYQKWELSQVCKDDTTTNISKNPLSNFSVEQKVSNDSSSTELSTCTYDANSNKYGIESYVASSKNEPSKVADGVIYSHKNKIKKADTLCETSKNVNSTLLMPNGKVSKSIDFIPDPCLIDCNIVIKSEIVEENSDLLEDTCLKDCETVKTWNSVENEIKNDIIAFSKMSELVPSLNVYHIKQEVEEDFEIVQSCESVKHDVFIEPAIKCNNEKVINNLKCKLNNEQVTKTLDFIPGSSEEACGIFIKSEIVEESDDILEDPCKTDFNVERDLVVNSNSASKSCDSLSRKRNSKSVNQFSITKKSKILHDNIETLFQFRESAQNDSHLIQNAESNEGITKTTFVNDITACSEEIPIKSEIIYDHETYMQNTNDVIFNKPVLKTTRNVIKSNSLEKAYLKNSKS